MNTHTIKGYATADATLKYARRFEEVAYRHLGSTELMASACGFGTYRVDRDHSEHRTALTTALLGGINLIDTSTNYGDGDAERVIGETLRELIADRKLARADIVVVSKIGYIQGENLERFEERQKTERPYQKWVQFSPNGYHSIDPEFIHDQLTLSLERLGLETLDFLLLHNPEYALKTGVDHREYYERIQAAFTALELEVDRGRIRAYGISSNTFGDPKESDAFTSLTAAWECAERVSPRPHFKMIQLPFNLLEAGPVFEPNNLTDAGHPLTVLEKAERLNLAVLVNRPLNAFLDQRLVRLAGFPRRARPTDKDGQPLAPADHLRECLARTMEHETALTHVLPPAGSPGALSSADRRNLSWGHILHTHLEQLADGLSWREALHWQIEPGLHAGLKALARSGTSLSAVSEWSGIYQVICPKLFEAVSDYLEEQHRREAEILGAAIAAYAPAHARESSLSQLAIQTVLAFPQVSSVLVGARAPRYVDDVLGIKKSGAKMTETTAREIIHACHLACEQLVPTSQLGNA